MPRRSGRARLGGEAACDFGASAVERGAEQMADVAAEVGPSATSGERVGD